MAIIVKSMESELNSTTMQYVFTEKNFAYKNTYKGIYFLSNIFTEAALK